MKKEDLKKLTEAELRAALERSNFLIDDLDGQVIGLYKAVHALIDRRQRYSDEIDDIGEELNRRDKK